MKFVQYMHHSDIGPPVKFDFKTTEELMGHPFIQNFIKGHPTAKCDAPVFYRLSLDWVALKRCLLAEYDNGAWYLLGFIFVEMTEIHNLNLAHTIECPLTLTFDWVE